MDVPTLVYTLCSIAAGLFVTFGCLLATMQAPEFRVARWFMFAASVAWCAVGVTFGVTYTGSMIIRLALTGIVGASGLVGLSESLRWIDRKEVSCDRQSLDRLPPPVRELSENVARTLESYRNLSDEGLKAKVANLVAKMRIFEDGLKQNQLSPIPTTMVSMTAEQRKRIWEEHTQEILKRNNDATTEFRLQFLPTILALREEILRRQGIFPPYPADPRLPALTGMLAGVRPISDLADYLDQIARRLP